MTDKPKPPASIYRIPLPKPKPCTCHTPNVHLPDCEAFVKPTIAIVRSRKPTNPRRHDS